jgi:hypothetical protein
MTSVSNSDDSITLGLNSSSATNFVQSISIDPLTGDLVLQGVSGQTLSAAGGSSVSASDGSITISDPSQGTTFSINPVDDDSDLWSITSSSGDLNLVLAPGEVGDVTLGSTISATTSEGDLLSLNADTGAGSITLGTVTESISAGSDVELDPNDILVGSAGSLGTDYEIGADGQLDSTSAAFLGLALGSTFAATDSLVGSLESSVGASITMDTPSGSISNGLLTTLNVFDLGDVPEGTAPYTTDPTSTVQYAIAGPDDEVGGTGVNSDGLLDTSVWGNVTGDWRPGNQVLGLPENSLDDQVTGFADTSQDYSSITYGAPLSDYSSLANSWLDIDPLVLDLNGDGISLSNWISNSVYFDTNVTYDSSTGTYVADGEEHHTSWVNASDGILVFDPGSTPGPITNITQTLSEFFQGGSYANGFGALATLATPGATAFSAATSLTDPNTGQLYWNELYVWQDANQDGVSQPSELESLASLGVTSISLEPAGNEGQEINGSAVTASATYSTATGQYEIDSIDLQTDTTGDVATTADGGVEIESIPEGGPTPTSTFVDKNTASQSLYVSDGTITGSLGTITGSGGAPITAIFSTSENDTITIAPTDTGDYWIGGGSGADTLTGGAGNTVFLVNAATVIHGGSGFNIAQVIDDAPADIDLMKATPIHLIIGKVVISSQVTAFVDALCARTCLHYCF